MLPVEQSQHISSSKTPLLSNSTSIVREFVNPSIHFFSSHAPNSLGGVILVYSLQYFNHQLLERDIFCCVISPVCDSARPFFILLVTCLVTAQNLLQIRKFSTNFSQMENTVRHISVTGNSKTELLHFHHNVLCSSFNCVGSLLVKPKDFTLFLTLSVGSMSSFMHMLLIYVDVAFIVSSSCPNTILTIAFIIRGATLRPN